MGDINNITTKTFEVEFGGKKFEFKFTLAGFAFLAKKYGSVVAALQKLDEEKIKTLDAGSLDALIDFIYAGVMWKDRSIKVEDLASLIDMNDLMRLPNIIITAVGQSLPQGSEKPENPT